MQKYLRLILLFLVTCNYSSAETKTFVREYTYQAGEYDSRLTCRAIAMAEAKRLLLEELGTYLKSSTTVQNGVVVSDDVSIYTAGAVQTKLVEEKWDGALYWIKVQMDADPDSVELAVKRLRADQGKAAEMESLKVRSNLALQEIAQLNQALQQSGAQAVMLSYQIKYLENARKLSAVELSQQGMMALMKNDNTGALLAYSNALELDSNNTANLVNRGVIYARLGYYGKAIKDYNKALNYNIKDYKIHYNRGIAYYNLKEYTKAQIDFNHSIELKPEHAKSYFNRALAYEGMKYIKLALADYGMALKLDSMDVQTYCNRGALYQQQKLYGQALADYNKAIEVNHGFADAYLNRAGLFALKGDIEAALADARKAAELGNEEAKLLLERLVP